MATFKHRDFGSFRQHNRFGEVRWEAVVELPAFASFKYRSNGRQRRTGRVPTAICCDGEPTKEALKVLATIRKFQNRLVKNICNAFLEDLHQQGYVGVPGELDGYGMWWSRDPVAVALSCRDVLIKRRKRERICDPEDLFAVLYEPTIEIRIRDGLPRTLIDMEAEFEPEHGVSVLTDGRKVLGLGYSGES
ncbi:MAG: hypothetical protein U0795_24885 [Pirellulales bacterium]